MAIYHVVMFQFKSLVPPDEVQAACDRMLALGDKCMRPTTQKPYVKTLGGGRENSPEGMNNGMTHVFISQFENEDDRTYYLQKDPAHLDFVASIQELVDKVQVVDFTAGAF
ncbi:stress responsive A/B barrel domain protein [Xylariaceae sp. FL0016]|nr:stress responsive A/B barrel domain protein [Xylariaceae sp. FL0016]